MENARLEVHPQFLDLGAVWAQQNYPWTITFFNPTSRAITIDRFDVSCDCTSIKPPTLRIPAHGAADVQLNLDLTSRDVSSREGKFRNFSVRLVPVLAAGLPQYAGWTIRGRVLTAMEFSPPRVDFGESLILGQRFESLLVEGTSAKPLKNLVLETDAPHLATAELEYFTPGENVFFFRVVPAASAPFGLHRLHCLVSGDTVEGERLPPTELPVTMYVLRDLHALPGEVAWGRMTLGETRTESIVLRSRTGKQIEHIDVLAAESAGLRVERSEFPEDQAVFQIHQRAVAVGQQSSAVTFQVRSPESDAVIALVVPVTYYGVAPESEGLSP